MNRRKMTAIRLTAFLTALFLAACGRSDPEPGDAREALSARGSLDVLEEAAKDSYEPPADGRLTSRQVEMYLKVRERQIELLVAGEDLSEREEQAREARETGSGTGRLRQGLQSLERVGDLFSADLRAAQELGHNTAEYRWVRDQIVQARITAMSEQMDLPGMTEDTLEQLNKARAQAPAGRMREMLERQIAQFERHREEMEQERIRREQDPRHQAARANAELVSGYEERLEELDRKLNQVRP